MAKSRKFMDALTSLDEEQFSAYLVLLGKGPLTVSEASYYLDQPLESVKESFDELQEKGFAIALPRTVPIYSATMPFHSLADQLTAIGNMQTKIGKSIGTSSERFLDAINSGVTSLSNSFQSQETELNEILENITMSNEKAVKRVVIDNNEVLNERATTLRTDLDNAVEATKTGFSTALDKVKTIIHDTFDRFDKNLKDLTSQETLNKNIDQLSRSMEAFRALPVRLIETIRQYNDGMSKRITDFNSAIDRALGKFGQTVKTVKLMQETTDTSLQSIAEELNSTLSSVGKDLVEAIGNESTSREKLSLQTTFTDIHVNTIESIIDVLDKIPPTYAELIEKLESRLDKLSSGIKRQVRDYSEAIFSSTTPDSPVWKLLDAEMESLESETRKVEEAVSRWIELVLAKTEELLGRIETDSTVTLQSLEENVGDFAAKSIQQFDQSEPLTAIQGIVSKVGQYEEQVSKAYSAFEVNLNRFRSEILKQVDRLVERHGVSISGAAKTLESTIKEWRDKNVDVTELSANLGVLTEAGKELGQLRDETSSKLISLGSEIVDSARKLTIEPSKMVLIASGQLKEELGNLEKKVSIFVDSVTDEIHNAIAKTRKKLEEEKNRRGELESALKEIQTKSNETIERQFASIDDSLKKFKEETSRTLNTQIQRLEKSIDDESKGFKGYLTESNTATNNTIELQRAIVSELQKKMNDSILKPLKRINEELAASLTKVRELVNGSLSDTRKGIGETVLNVLNEVHATVDSIGGKVTEIADENNKMMETHSKQAANNIDRLCTKETENIILETANTINSLRGKLNEIKISLSEQAGNMTTRVGEETTILVDRANNQLSSFKERLKIESTKLIPSIVESFSNSVTSLTSQQNVMIKERVAEFIKNHKNKQSRTLEEIKEVTNQQTTTMRSEVGPTIDEITTGAKRNAEILMKFDEHLRPLASATTGEKTWPLFSKRAIEDHIRGMISRAKVTLFIDAPTSSYLPPAKELEKRREIFFQILLGEETENKAETDGGKTGAAIGNDVEPFKALTNARFVAVNRSPYIVVNRDNEEILFGIEDGEGKKIDATATVSEEKSYINLVREVIAPSLLLETEKQEISLTKEIYDPRKPRYGST
nr:hypothetical protein [Candidatus Njordarchaeum guaymaensis]